MTGVLELWLSDANPERRRAIEECARALGLEVAALPGSMDAGPNASGSGPPPDASTLDQSGVIVLAEPSSPSLVRGLRALAQGSELSIMVVTAEHDEPAAWLAAGADDVLRWPSQRDELGFRLQAHLRVRRSILALARKERDAQVMLELTQTLASALDFREILFTVVRRIAESVNFDRVSIVLSPASESGRTGFVVAASDDPTIQNLRIDLDRYPEILEVLGSRAPLTILDASTHPLLEGVRDSVPQGALGSLTLLPIVWQSESMGVLFLRGRPGRGELVRRELEFCQIVANATAVALRNARIMQSLRDQSQQENFARFEAERRLRGLTRYANLFASSADGLAALDPEGRLLFANPRAYEIADLDEEAARGRMMMDLVVPTDQARMRTLWAGVQEGHYPRGVDVRFERKGGSIHTFSCSFSSLLDGEGAVLLSFRDVTDERATAAELARTKDFLESLIDASVDAIIAADLHGTILLFNKGAERIYGRRAADVVGQLHVRELYPPGGAEEVMRMIRAAQLGGPGRLESVRFDALDAAGALVPIHLSAALIVDDEGHPLASVGIFTDLRERLRVEQRLAHAQQKLEVSEKQALLAELAGTAAHELNQPLTSVMGYAQLLQRKLPSTTSEHHAAAVIVREAERMADIVRKIGKITRYETKSYVGQQKILDLDASSASSPGIAIGHELAAEKRRL